MRILITGVCGFVGSSIARRLLETMDGLELSGIDNLIRPGSETNRESLRASGVRVIHGDIRMASDVDLLPEADWIIDAAANPSVLAGIDGKSSSRQVLEHNLIGTVNLLEYCRRVSAGLILLSTNRVYSIPPLAALPVIAKGQAFHLDTSVPFCRGVSAAGVTEQFSVEPPASLYGSTKRASELLALEYSAAFGFPVWIDRCGVLAGAGQFGTAEQGIFSYWLHAHAAKLPLRFIGFGGLGYEVRDAFHPADLADLLRLQMQRDAASGSRIFNVGGGMHNAMSLAELTAWCDTRFGPHSPAPDLRPRTFDIPWLIMDGMLVESEFGWKIRRTLPMILDEIAQHVQDNPDWLQRCAAI